MRLLARAWFRVLQSMGSLSSQMVVLSVQTRPAANLQHAVLPVATLVKACVLLLTITTTYFQVLCFSQLFKAQAQVVQLSE